MQHQYSAPDTGIRSSSIARLPRVHGTAMNPDTGQPSLDRLEKKTSKAGRRIESIISKAGADTCPVLESIQ